MRRDNIFNDGIAFVESYDFSRGNMSEEDRIRVITMVASVCYQSPKAFGSEVLYNRLLSESLGLPSSSFEFVPVLLDMEKPGDLEIYSKENSHVRQFGEMVEDGRYWLTNYRAIVYDKEAHQYSLDITSRFNTAAECDIIRKHFKVFLQKVDLPTRSQMVRHRVSWQELSRRYVSGKRVQFEFYIDEAMSKVVSEHGSTEEIIAGCVEHYYKSLEDGVKPEKARRIIPQAAYTQIWSAFMPSYLTNFLSLRTDSHAQYEIRQLALAMQSILREEG